MATAADLKFILSGGAANTDPAAALGGAISTAAGGVILSQSFTASTIPGVTIDDAAGNAVGVGGMTYTSSGTTLRWTPPGGAIGIPVNIGTSGSYAVYGADNTSHIKVTSVAASLSVDTAQSVAIAYQTNKLFDDVAQSESSAGDTEYRCFYVQNTHAADSVTGTKIWIGSDASGADSLQIGLDPIGAGGTATTIADEGTAPTGVTFTAPTDETTSLVVGTLTTGNFYAVWIKRVVPITGTSTAADISRLKVRFI